MAPLLLLLACTGDPAGESADSPTDSTDSAAPTTRTLEVLVTLDGAPSPDTSVLQGGNPARWVTDADGHATILVDFTIHGDYVMASHPEARILGDRVDPDTPEPFVIALTRYDTSDNPDYVFQDPGEGEWLNTNTSHCLHCHRSIHADWWESPHRSSASNPSVQDLYQGTAAAWSTAGICATAGGVWGPGIEPGTGAATDRCFVGDGVLPLLDGTGACADCHAPGIDGALGGRDLLEATGFAYDYGVHCDVCHRVSGIDPAGEPGVAGRLQMMRPSEVATSVGMGSWQPLTFGPWDDVPNGRMGSVHRDEFHTAEFCSGCHESAQPVLVAGESADLARWPDGRLPIHTTYGEWQDSPMNPASPCQNCHMPPDAEAPNGADIEPTEDDPESLVVASGWVRPPGSVRHHGWYGPRQPESRMLELAASIDVASRVEGGALVAEVTVRNVAMGHALPTGEPLRALLLTVGATCDGVALAPVGGQVIPDHGGYEDRKDAGEDWSAWPGAAVGDVIRVIVRPGGWEDYVGWGPFGDGTFDAAAKGMPVETWAGEATITGVSGDAVTLSAALPAGDVAYRVRGAGRAGAPGWAFARVLVGADGTRMVPHFAAVDVVSDNRLLPGLASTSTHRFAATCAAPEVHAALIHRNYPYSLASERGWAIADQVMTETTR